MVFGYQRFCQNVRHPTFSLRVTNPLYKAFHQADGPGGKSNNPLDPYERGSVYNPSTVNCSVRCQTLSLPVNLGIKRLD